MSKTRVEGSRCSHGCRAKPCIRPDHGRTLDQPYSLHLQPPTSRTCLRASSSRALRNLIPLTAATIIAKYRLLEVVDENFEFVNFIPGEKFNGILKDLTVKGTSPSWDISKQEAT
ncbi:hypothetical protein F3Y22_tig00110198pilonHSYRG00345 [Hibiscus syriacus]|uniref:Uncharacterized protein n=1 Tax=Hibiscus syriacus TaxID=106335 RepID=A0A6A3BBY7_HIBSY|nr:hypothetical protein F3Y22_tig00110198pilonHSYRG00345 [Hibiscus syriacus]